MAKQNDTIPLESTGYDTERFQENLAKISSLSAQISRELTERQLAQDGMAVATSVSLAQAFRSLMLKAMEDPGKLVKAQLDFWEQSMRLVSNTTARFLGENVEPLYAPSSKDKRFKDKAWQENLIFDFLKQSYLLTSHWMQRLVKQVDHLDPRTQTKVDFAMRQFVDALSPSNFLLTNPEVLRQTIESNGENIVRGLENLKEDLERSHEVLRISSTDHDAFAVGKNLAVTPGKVIFQNDLLQLIQYEPTTKQVFSVPVVIISPWINKYYILDLRPGNSFVKWLVDQGYTVFITSWVNPDAKLASKTFEDYMKEGVLAALDAAKKATGENSANVIGYCIGGTLLAATLAYLHASGQESIVKSATYFTTLLDFADPGELSVFIDEMQLAELEEKMKEKGYLDGGEMAAVFSILRANEMIWSFVVNNYMMGKEPFEFDLLYWNADSTRLPAAMHSYYLRKMYLENVLVKPNGLTLGGAPINLSKITTPSYMVSTIEDHIAPWKSTFEAMRLFGKSLRFVLSGSGHVAGIVNPPAQRKYWYWTNDKIEKDANKWLLSAARHEGSWWPDWLAWVKDNGFGGRTVPARIPDTAIEDAPGSYVKVRY